MRRCGTCLVTYDDREVECRIDGAALVPIVACETAPLEREEDCAPHAQLVAGDPIGPLHRVVRLLGEGGMGLVYEVEHVRTGGRWAAKVLRPEATSARGVASRFEQEAIVATLSDHPNVVQVVSLDETEDGRPFIIEELLVGRDLAAILRDGAIPIDEALALGDAAARALASVHARGVIHLDLKPANLFLAEKHGARTLKILDFGISKVAGTTDASRRTWTGPILGTAAYVAPEQTVPGAPVGPAADVYALGLVLFEMVAGRRAFDGDDPIALVVSHRSARAPAPSTVRPSLPRQLDGLILRALEKRPEDRYGSMADLAQAIVDCAATLHLTLDRLPGDRPRPAPREPGRTPRRAGWLPLALGAGLVALLALIALSSRNQEPREPTPVPAPSAMVAPTASVPPPGTVAETSPIAPAPPAADRVVPEVRAKRPRYPPIKAPPPPERR